MYSFSEKEILELYELLKISTPGEIKDPVTLISGNSKEKQSILITTNTEELEIKNG